MNWTKIIIGIVILAGAVWTISYVLTPPPGQKLADQGREHLTLEEVDDYSYNSNPPTSGRHHAQSQPAGIYDAPIHDGHLIHSLEHGYIIISYNCNVHLSVQKPKKHMLVSRVFAHEEDGAEGSPSATFTIQSEATGSATGRNDSEECSDLVQKLTEVTDKKRLWKIIVIPRPTLDTTIALTAWTYIDKFDQFDAGRIERFIDYHRDHGPEKTME